MHSERGFHDKNNDCICVKSENLIDFFLIVFKKMRRGCIILCESKSVGNIFFKRPHNTKVLTVAFPEVKQTFPQQLKRLIIYLKTLLNREYLEEIATADYSISVGLCFSGTVFGLERTLIAKKNHRFVIRGNRFETLRKSSMRGIKKYFALGRILIYENIVKYLVESGRAEVWFQGQDRYVFYRNKWSVNARDRLFLLNAVLRDLPDGDEKGNYKKIMDLVFVGRINAEKGVFDLIQALSILAAEGLQPKLLFIGEGADKTRAINLAKQLLSPGQVEFKGYVSYRHELTGLIKRTKLFVLPSHTEGVPRSMIESMYLGVPVLVTPVGGIKYIIRDGENGFLTPPQVPAELAHKIKDILKLIDQNKVESIVDKARTEALKYTFDERAKYFLEHFVKQSNNQK
jgi:glycosyltransferase involved in cell wall biosynthesis